MLKIHESEQHLPALTRVFALLGKRWNGLLIAALATGPAGFIQVRRRVPGISDRMLSDRLHELTTAGIVTRTVHPGPPARTLYALTERGSALLGPLHALACWGREHLPPQPHGADEAPTG
ncbi:helix-turn-helix transcriptional regulator [Streptomyces sp. NBC_01537]|uniref:winged helix-turn-helix transcriptional regulator n=1 Tax=Streptomyces sp. NBC_01537 TaxID=2903896 RepID=UPI00386890EE